MLEVSPSGYYAARRRLPCARAIADERLLLHVRIAHTKSGGNYGASRVQRELKDDGFAVGTKRVACPMRQDGRRAAAYYADDVNLSGGPEEPSRVSMEMVSTAYFPVLGVQPMLGRGFLPSEDSVPGTHPSRC